MNSIPEWAIYAILTVVGSIFGFLFTEVYNGLKNKELRDTVKILQASMTELTHAVIRLTVKLEEFDKKIEDLPEIRKDLHYLHAKVRERET